MSCAAAERSSGGRGREVLDLRATLERERIDLTVYLDNVTNDRAELAATTSFGPTQITLERPRTIGAAITVHF